MSSGYQTHQNPSGPISTTTVIGVPPPQQTVFAAPPPTHLYHVNTTRNLGITMLIFGILTLVCGIVAVADTPGFWFSATGAGFWASLPIIITGILCICSASNPEVYGTRCAALSFSIISICIAFISGIMAYIGFITMLTCNRCYDYDDYNYNCSWSCDRSGLTMAASALMSVMMTVVFILGIVLSVYTGRGCCGGYSTGGTVIVQQPGMYPPSTIITSSAPAYQPPPYSASSYPPPQSSAPYQGAPHQQQPYMQAQGGMAQGGMAQTNVTYGSQYPQKQ